ncbi:MAG: DUF1727 domain-containing protein, partial [Collinsella sp.]|nr:DUF1727 domain-containing protein [Collinsella sp.]
GAAADLLGCPPPALQRAIDAFNPQNGRLQTFDLDGRRVLLNLAKNPTGFNQNLKIVAQDPGRKVVAFFINDKVADGCDVSWLWDIDFEELCASGELAVLAGGLRGRDMQVRLKYAGIDSAIISNIEQAIGAVADEEAGDTFYAVANYTAFPPLIKELDELKSTDASSVASHAVTRADGSAVPTDIAPVELSRPLRIVYLYPDALNLYGDGGNVIALERRCAWRGIPVRVDEVRMGESLDLTDADIVMMGGGSDRDQLAVAHELFAQKDKVAAYVEDGGSLLAICGSYQLLGRSYYMGENRIEGLGVIAAETVRGSDRLIGNVAVKTDLSPEPFVGFENHGGRTLLDAEATPLGTSVVTGTGNNGDDGFEGIIYKGVIGTYLHGPALPKNPELADWLIAHALERRGDARATALLPLKPLDDTYEHAAHDAAMKLLL